MRKARNLFRVLSIGLLIGLTGCHGTQSQSATSATMDQSEQARMTPDQAIARLKDGNQRMLTGASLRRDVPAQLHARASGQHPFAVVLACVDSRSSPELIFDQGIGDLFVARVAGNYCPIDLLGSIEFATKVAGAKLVVVMGHTSCGAIKETIEGVELGNITAIVHALHPALADVPASVGERTAKNKKFVLAVTEANVRRTVASIRARSEIMRELEESGQVKIVGAMLDIKTGQVRFID